MNLFESLQQREPLNVAVVGAGGKTTAVFQLARQVGGCAWVTTTTHLGTDQLHLADKHFTIRSANDIDVPGWLAQKVSLLSGERTSDDRIKAPDGALLESIAALAKLNQISLIVEADGARSHAIKAPGEHEPMIPSLGEHGHRRRGAFSAWQTAILCLGSPARAICPAFGDLCRECRSPLMERYTCCSTRQGD